MNPIFDFYLSQHLAAVATPSHRRSVGSDSGQVRERPQPPSVLERIKLQMIRCASGVRRLEIDVERYHMADWWVGL